MAAFMVLTAASSAPKAYYVWLYLAKVVIVTAVLVAFRTPEGYPTKAHLLVPAVLVGLVVFIEWILLDKSNSLPAPGRSHGLDPYCHRSSDPTLYSLQLALRPRIYGASDGGVILRSFCYAM